MSSALFVAEVLVDLATDPPVYQEALSQEIDFHHLRLRFRMAL